MMATVKENDEIYVPVSHPRATCLACRRSKEKKPTRVTRYPCQGAKPITACRFTIQHSREILVGVGPTTYNTERVTSAFTDTLNKVISTRGFSLGARLAPRFYQRSAVIHRDHQTHSKSKPHCSNNTRPLNPIKPNNCPPFNSSASRQPLFVASAVPGPGSYNTTATRDRRIPFTEHLGSGRTMVTAVSVCCAPVNDVRCDVCGEQPFGDYWRSPHKILCRDCMHEAQAAILPRRTHSAPQYFRKERDCSEVHCHEGTRAAVRLRTERQQRRTRVREAYLSLYFA